MQSFLYEILLALDAGEKEALSLFLQSPYFNRGSRSDKVLVLFHTLSEPHSHTMSKEQVYAKVYPETPWIAGKLDKLMSELNGLIRQFLLVEHYMKSKDDFPGALDWANILRRRGLMNRYASNLRKAETLLQEGRVESLETYYNAFRLAYEKFDMESQGNKVKGGLQILPAIVHLDAYFLACRLEMINMWLLQQKMTRLELTIQIPLVTPNLLPEDVVQRHIMLQIALKINEQLVADRPSAAAFHEIFALIQKNEPFLAAQVLQNFYAYLRNFCAFLIEMEDTSFLPLLHYIQKDNLEKGFMLLDGKLSPSAYLSVVRTALRVGRSAWAAEFIENYKDRLIAEGPAEDYYHYNKAACLFYNGAYAAALEVLPTAFSDALYLTHCRRLELKLYYELQSELLPYKIDAYKMFLSRASKTILSELRREFEGNFVNLLQQIINCPPKDTVKVDRIVNRIERKNHVADREWLLEKTNKLV